MTKNKININNNIIQKDQKKVDKIKTQKQHQQRYQHK